MATKSDFLIFSSLYLDLRVSDLISLISFHHLLVRLTNSVKVSCHMYFTYLRPVMETSEQGNLGPKTLKFWDLEMLLSQIFFL